MKRKTIHMLHICLALVLGAAALLPSSIARPCQAEPEKEVLRLHILANSDSQAGSGHQAPGPGRPAAPV